MDISHRKVSKGIKITDADNNPISNEKVHVSLKNHEFLFGCGAFEAIPFVNMPDDGNPWKKLVTEGMDKWLDVFNYGTLPFYWGNYEREEGKTDELLLMPTAKFLQKQLMDDAPNQVENWYLLYSDWQQKFANFENAPQSQFVRFFEENFQNILQIYIPRTDAASKYTQMDTKISTTSKVSTTARSLAIEINKLVNMLTGETSEDKWVERF